MNKLAAIKRTSIKAGLVSAYEAYQRREPGSMDKLLALVRKFVYMKLYHLEHDFKDFGSAETVDDWTQDVSIRVWQSLLKDDRRSPASFYAWVHKIAFNEGNAAFNKLIKEKATKVPLMVPISDEDAGTDEDEQENPELHEEEGYSSSVRIPASVQGVDRQICNLLLTTIRCAEDGRHRGRNYAEVGQVLNMTEAAVESRIRQIRKNIKTDRARGGGAEQESDGGRRIRARQFRPIRLGKNSRGQTFREGRRDQGGGSGLNQIETIKLLQNLLFSENKPEQLRPVDLLLVTYLILRQTEDHCIYDSHLTLATRLGCERRTIADSIKRLSAMGWITTEKPWTWNEKTKRKTRSIGRTVGLSINVPNLPQSADKTQHAKPSPDAIDLARWHTALLIDNGIGGATRYKTFDRQQQYAAQSLIDTLGDQVSDVIAFALNDPRHLKQSRTSLYRIRAKLPAIKRDFDVAQSAASSGPAPSVAG